MFNPFCFFRSKELLIKPKVMKRILQLSLLSLLFLPLMGIGQNLSIEVPIRATGGTVNDTLDNGTVVTLELSSDDAEQENDEVDTPYDDDLDAGWEGAPDDQNTLTVGLRFREIYIPGNAIIDSAFIEIYSHEGKGTDDVAEIKVVGEAADHPESFDEENFNNDYLLTDRPETEAYIDWTVDEEWIIWQPYRTPDISSIVQELIEREGWEMGNAMAFFLKGKDQGPSSVENAREFEAFENIADPEDTDPDGNPGDGQNHPERVPKLIVYYSVPSTMAEYPIQATGGTVNDTLDNGTVVTLELSSDDAEQENDEVDTPYDDDLDAGWEGAPDDQNILTLGLRFRDINIPKGVNIDSAFIHMYSHEGKGVDDVAEIIIAGQAADSAETFDEENFNSDYLITDRPRTEAQINWTVAEEWIIWQPYSTPDVSSIVQEVIDREGWKPGFPIAFFLMGQDQGPSTVENAREFEAFENIADPEDTDPDGNPGDGQNHPERVPKLVVYYSAQGGTNSVFEMTLTRHKALKVYPNPSATGNFTVELNSDKDAEIMVYNQQGQMIKLIETTNTRSADIQLGNHTDGVYVVKALQDGVVYTQKLIIK